MMSISKQKTGIFFGLTMLLLSITACDEQTATINEDSALRAAACALSPTELPILSKLAFDLETQAQSNRASGLCAEGGLISWAESGENFTATADHCAYTNDTGSFTVNGSLDSIHISDSPVTLDWTFQNAALFQRTSDEEIGDRVNGSVRFQHFETDNSVSQVFAFDSLEWGQLENSFATGVIYGVTKETIQQDLSTHATSFNFTSRVELCGIDAFALDVSTVEPLIQLESEFYPSSGMLEATAGDGSSLSISLNGDILAIDLDSNGDKVNDFQLSMTWGDFEGATTVASRQRNANSSRPAQFFGPWRR